MKPVIIHDEARSELDEAMGYYEEKRAGLGLSLGDEVEKAVGLIRLYPQIGVMYKSTDYRYWVLARFPFVIYYLELENATWVMAIAHRSRRPDYWRRRPAHNSRGKR